MCGRYAQNQSVEDLEAWLGADVTSANLPSPSWNIAPTQHIPILLEDQHHPGVTRLEPARWAFTPPWSETLETRSPHFNARIETVLEKPIFQNAILKRRCLIPASGYYEWTTNSATGSKTPRFIYADDKEPIAFAGIAGWWHDKATDTWHLTSSMLTMDSYGPAGWIHPRIPVFASEETWSEWLDPETEVTEGFLKSMAHSSHAIGEQLSSHAVAPLKGDGPKLTEQVN